MSKRFVAITTITILVGIILACAPEQRQSDPYAPPAQSTFSFFKSKKPKLQLEKLEILIYESFPVEAEASLQGFVGDSCLKLSHTLPDQQGNTFMIKVAPKQDDRFPCTGRQKPFAITIALPVDGLYAGTYQVKINELEDEFDLMVDNIIRD